MLDPILKYKCPQCGHVMQVKRPAKSGVYNRVCPACQFKHQIKVTGTEEMQKANQPQAAAPAPAPAASPAPAPAPAPAPTPQAAPAVPPVPPPMPQMAPKAPQAKSEIHTDPIHLKKKGPAKLTLIGTLFNNSYPLDPGEIVIGRDDPTDQSDIALKGDPCVSRRSLKITVKRDEINGYSFRLKVLKSTNPVLLNGSVLDGRYDEPFLNYGDTITVGKTKLRIDPLK